MSRPWIPVAFGLAACAGALFASMPALDSTPPTGPAPDRTPAARAIGVGGGGWTAAAASETDDGLYRTDEVMVSAVSADALAGLATDFDLNVRGQASGGRLALVEVPPHLDRAGLLAALAADPRVASTAPNAVMAGAGKKDKPKRDDGASESAAADPVDAGSAEPDTTPRGDREGLATLQWHLDGIGLPANQPNLSGITVAVLDTGVAYADDGVDQRGSVASPSLAGVAIVSPRDFVDDDDLPYDEHQHGTHIASLIAAAGDVMGVAPGVALMPVRVLDKHNRGTGSISSKASRGPPTTAPTSST